MTTYYVGPVGVGSDAASGADPAQAMSLTALQARMATLQPGDTVLFLGGVYRNATFNDGNIWKDPLDLALRIKDVQGTAEAPITFAAAPGEHVTMQFDGAGGIRVTQSQHVKIQGFDVAGPNQDITLQEALADQFAYRIDRVNGPTLYRDPTQDLGVGNSIASPGGNQPQYYHSSGIAVGNATNHIEIVDNRVHDAPGYGISSLGGADYLTIRNNVVYNNAWWGGGNHGISVQNAVSSDTYTGNKIIIDGYTLSDNYAKTISWATLKTGPVTMVLDEGKGIHLQENESATGLTHGEILISNNLVVRSGNAGITESLSERVNIINNTLVDNGYINTLMAQGLTDPNVEAGFSVAAGGLRLAGGSDVTIANNLISVSDATLNVVDATSGLTAANASFTNNQYVGGTGPFLRSGDTTLAQGFGAISEAGFVSATAGNYRLAATSLAVNAGSTALGSTTDLNGDARTDGQIDVGALERSLLVTPMVTLNTALTQDETLRAAAFAMPSRTLTIELQVGLPANWELSSQSVTLAQYGTGGVSASGFAITTWDDYLDVYIAGRQFNTTIAMTELIGQTRRLSFTWDSTTGTAKSYLDGTLVDTAIVATGRTIASGQSFTLGAGAADEVLPRATFGDVRIFDVVRSDVEIAATAATTLSGSEAGLVGYWTPSTNQLTSSLGDAAFALQQQAIATTDRGALALDTPRHGTIAAANAHDTYTVDLVAGQTYSFAAVGIGGASLTDTYLRLAGPGGTVVASDNDTLPNDFSKITFTAATSGAYTLDVYGALQRVGDYGVSVAVGTKAVFDVAMGAGVLDSHSTWTDTRGAGVTLTYGFQVNDPGERTNFAVFSEAQKAATREILALYADISGLTFVEVAPSIDPVTGLLVDTAQMLMSNYSQSDGSGGHAHYPRNGDVHINTAPLASMPRGSYAWYTMLHEIGHALGLSHPSDYGGPGGYAGVAQFITDTTQYSNLSYWGAENSGGNLGGYGETPMLFDVLAIQNLYGANTATRTGDTTYGFNSNAGRDVFDFTINTRPGVTIWDAGGIDTIDLSVATANQQITLVSGAFSDVLGLSNNLTVAIGATVENAIGGHGNDTISGNDVANALTGNDGNDSLLGGLGADSLEGGRGADMLDGGDGADRLIGDGAGLITDPAIFGLALNSGTGASQSLRRTGIADLPTTAMTFEFDVKFAAAPVYQWLFDFPGLSLLIDPTNNGAAGIWVLVDGSWTYSGISVTQLGDGNSHRVSFTWDSASGAYAHYLDGTEVKSGTGFKTGAVLAGTGNLTIDQVNGAIGDIRVYNRALSAAEVLATANVVIPDPASATGLVLNWRVDSNGSVTDARGGAAPTINAGTGTAPAPTLLIAETTFADLLSGGAGDDTLLGGQGNDTLDGGSGADSLDGGDGDDLYMVDSASDTALEAVGRGHDTVVTSVTYRLATTSDVEDARAASPSDLTVVHLTGNALANRLTGNAAGNILTGLDGADTLVGLDGNDTLIGGVGADSLVGGAGNDGYYVDSAADRAVEAHNEGIDTVYASTSFVLGAGQAIEFVRTTDANSVAGIDLAGNEFANTLIGNAGSNRLSGGLGDDVYYINGIIDTLIEAVDSGNDSVFTSATFVIDDSVFIETLRTIDPIASTSIDLTGNVIDNTLLGNNGSNLLSGRGGNDALTGNGGHDTLDGGSGVDRLYGGGGDDVYLVDTASDIVVEVVGEGLDEVRSTTSYTLRDVVEVEMLRTADESSTLDIRLTANRFDNTVSGNAGSNRLLGLDGNDILNGLGGNDTLDGGRGADTAHGGSGNDVYYVDNGSDVVVEAANEGSDIIYAAVSYALDVTTAVESLRALDPNAIALSLTGNGLANTLIGSSGANTLSGADGDDILSGLNGADQLLGGDGADRLFGGLGIDTLTGGAGVDRFYFDGAMGSTNIDSIADFAVGIDAVWLSSLVFRGLIAGGLAADTFTVGPAATDALDRIVYDGTTGALFYDVDGVNGAVAIQFATLSAGLSLTSASFVIF